MLNKQNRVDIIWTFLFPTPQPLMKTVKALPKRKSNPKYQLSCSWWTYGLLDKSVGLRPVNVNAKCKCN